MSAPLVSSRPCEPLKRSERLVADVVLDAFGVAARRLLADPDGAQECEHDLMPPPAPLGERAALLGEKDRAVGRERDQACALQPRHRICYGGRRHPQTARNFDTAMNELTDLL